MQFTSDLANAMSAAKAAYFNPDYLALRDRLIDQIMVGSKTDMTADQWTPLTAQRMGTAVVVAERALDEARDYASAQYSAASRALAVQLAMLTFAVVLTVGAMIAVTRRVIRPLHNIRDAMLKVASGDLSVETGYDQRHDEIGALAGALEYLQAAGRGQGPDRGAGARAQRRRRRAPADDRGLCRGFRNRGAPDPCSSSATPPAR